MAANYVLMTYNNPRMVENLLKFDLINLLIEMNRERDQAVVPIDNRAEMFHCRHRRSVPQKLRRVRLWPAAAVTAVAPTARSSQ
jgi:hypothetical protein